MKAFLVLCCVFGGALAARLPLVATPIENGGLYKLENQDDGAFLAAGADGVVKGGEYTGQPGQKWVFNQVADDTYQITPQANENNNVSGNQYKTIKVSHGKRLFQNLATGLCITNGGRGRPVSENECGRDSPRQRWNVQDATTY